MLTRQLQSEVKRRLARFPAVALLGPRQCGKTTLARAIGGVYYDLEQEPERLRLDLEWADRVSGRERIILDEAQAWPEVFARLRGAIDRDRKRNGRFLLLAPSRRHWWRKPRSPSRDGCRRSTSRHSSGPSFRWCGAGLWLFGRVPDGGVLDADAFPRW